MGRRHDVDGLPRDQGRPRAGPTVHLDRAVPAARRAPFVLSLFWSMAEPETWPCLWGSADKILTQLGWLAPPGDFDKWYLDYREIVLTSGRSPFEVEYLLWWIDEASPFTGLDPALLDRCSENATLATALRANGNVYPTTDDAAAAERNARAIVDYLRGVASAADALASSSMSPQTGR